MANVKPNLSKLVAKQLPEFIQSDYQTFVAFIEAYYQFLEQNYNIDVIDVRSIDTTLDLFIDKFKAELDVSGVRFSNLDEKFLLPKLKDLYLSKGSEASYKLLMRLLFNKESSIKYPGQSTLKASDGNWIQQTSVLVMVNSGDPYAIVGKQIKIVSNIRKINVVVERIRSTDYINIYEVFLEQGSVIGDIVVGSVLQLDTYIATVVPTTTSFKILQSGSNFKLGQIFEVISGISGRGSIVKVKSINSTGGITGLQFIKFGYGYTSSFYQTLSPVLGNIIQSSIFSDILPSLVDQGYILNSDYFESSYTDGTYAGQILRNFYSDNKLASTSSSQVIIQFNIGGRIKYPGFYKNSNGFLSDAIYLQDSYYYQQYSYVVQISENLDKYKEIVKSYLHPAGMALFGEYQINNDFQVNAALTFILSFFKLAIADSIKLSDNNIKSSFKILVDSINSIDSPFKSMSKVFIDSTGITTDLANRTLTKYIIDSVITSDIFITSRGFNRPMTDSTITNDGNLKSFSKLISDIVISTEYSIKNFTKYIQGTNDKALPIDTGGNLYLNYYTDPLVWDSTYSAGAIIFT